MSGITPSGVLNELGGAAKPADDAPVASSHVAMSLAVEEVAISKRVRQTLVQASRTTSVRDQTVTADLEHEHVVVERIPVGRVVDAVPPVRQ